MTFAECIGCGFCCLKVPCEAAQRVYGAGIKLCPALQWDGERHRCALMDLPGDLGLNFRKELHAGAGCCSNLNTWRKEPLQDRRPQPKSGFVSEIDPIFQTFLHCLGKEWISGDVLMLALSAFKGMLVREGRSEEEAQRLTNQIRYYLRGERTRSLDDFMGGMS